MSISCKCQGWPVCLILFAATRFLVAADQAPTANRFQPVADYVKLPVDFTLGPCSAVAVNSRGDVILAHRGKQPIVSLNADGKWQRAWGDEHLVTPHGLRIDRDDNIWVTDIGAHRVLKFSAAGKLLLSLGTGQPGAALDQFNKPTDIAFGPQGEFFIADGYGNSRVLKFAADGRLMRTWGQPGDGKGEFDLPHSIVLDARGRVLVGDRENHRLQIFDQDGKLLDIWSGFAPYGLAFDRRGTLFVADGETHQVHQLNERGGIEQSWGGKGSEPGQFDVPHMLACDAAGNLYVAEIDGKRLQKFARK